MEPKGIDFSFAPFSEDALSLSVPTFAYLFEGQEDAAISGVLPELEERRRSVDHISRKSDMDVVTVQSIERGGKLCVVGMSYIQYPWKKKKVIDVGSINLLREVADCTQVLTRRAREGKFAEINILLPDRFSPRNVKDKAHREQLYFFVRTITESIIYTNNSLDEFMSNPDRNIERVNILFFGESQPAIDGFFKQAIGDGEDIGEALAYARRLIELPPNMKPPISFLKHALGEMPSIRPGGGWKKFKISKHTTASVIYGTEALKAQGFELIAAVGGGSANQPCLLKLHYKPTTTRQKKVKKIALTGKAVTFDSGGYDVKGTGYYDNMHFDVAGAADILGVMRLAERKNLPVELVAVIPIVESLVGPKAFLPGAIYKAYGGKTVKIVNTDCEGRLLMGEAIAYAERRIRPDATITAATLGNMEDFCPDILKVTATSEALAKKVRVAEQLSSEKVMLMPPLEYLNKVDERHEGRDSDLVNDIMRPHCYHFSPIVFMFNFFSYEPEEWIFVDVSAVFEDWASDYGAGPGFGLKFLWHLFKQFK